MFLQELLNQTQLESLLESPTQMPEGADLVTQLETLMARLEAAKRALGITNRLTNPAERKKHRSRIMTFLNQLRPMFDRVAKQLEQEQVTDDTHVLPQYRHAA